MTTEHTSSDQVAAYVAGCEQAVADALEQCRATIYDPTAYAAALDYWRHVRVVARSAKLSAYGIECPNGCRNGQVWMGDTSGRYTATWTDCRHCNGVGKVLPDDPPARMPLTERDPDEAYDARHDR